MKVIREEDNHLYTIIRVQPWPDMSSGASVRILLDKKDLHSGQSIRRVSIQHGQYQTDIAHAREWAQAILRACRIAEHLKQEGVVVLEGEE